MTRFIVRRLLQAIPVLLIITIVGFTLSRVTPNSPFQAELSLNPEVTQEDIARLEAKYGLDQPLPVQYMNWLSSMVRLDFGRSYFTKQPVVDMLVERLPATLMLATLSFGLSLFVGIPLGMLCAIRRNSMLDQSIRAVVVLFTALPSFAAGLIALVIFGGMLRWFPLGGMFSIGESGNIADRLHHLILPVLILGLDGCIGYIRVMRAQTLEVLHEDYIRTARAKGVPEFQVLTRHVLRNTLIPIWTSFGGLLVGLVAGVPLVERVFNWPGIGSMTLEAAFRRDFPVMLTTLMLGALLLMIGFLIRDIGYARIDPRIRYD